MAKFNTNLRMEYDREYVKCCGPWWVLESFKFYSDIIQREIIVPPHFPTDLASVPRLPVVYIMVGNTAIKPSVIHDYLYTSKELDRKTADKIFREACEVELLPWWRRNIMYIAIRWFGWLWYK